MECESFAFARFLPGFLIPGEIWVFVSVSVLAYWLPGLPLKEVLLLHGEHGSRGGREAGRHAWPSARQSHENVQIGASQ